MLDDLESLMGESYDDAPTSMSKHAAKSLAAIMEEQDSLWHYRAVPTDAGWAVAITDDYQNWMGYI